MRVAKQRAVTRGRVPHASGVERERHAPLAVLKSAFGVAKKGERSSGRVFAGNGVV